MPSKLQIYSQMARDAAGTVNASVGQWTGFLTTAARLYKYPYEDQLMIFTQRPDATACAEYDLWNERMNRYVKRGARGIALIDSSGDYPRLRYVFDVSDTGTRRNSRPVYLWKMQDDYEAPVQSALAKAFGVSESLPLESQLEQIANSLAVDYWQEHGQQFLDIVADSYLESYDEYNIEVAFRKAVAVSVTYQLYVRCLDDPASYFEHEDFLPIFDFNTRQTMNYLGAAVNGVSGQVFREIEVAIRTYERSRQAAERSQNHDERTDLHTERRLPDPEPRTDRAGAQAHGQVREDAQELPSGTQSDAVQRSGADRAAVPPSVGDSGDGHPENGTADGRAASEVSGTRQDDSADGVGRPYEQPESDGRGDSADGAGVQLNPFGDTVPGEFEQLSFIFPTEAEQIEAIDHAAESEMPSAFSLPQSDIDQIFRLGGNDDNSRMRVAAQFMMGKSTEEIAAFLRQEYRGGMGLNTDSGKLSAWFDEQGVWLARGDHARDAAPGMFIPWMDAADRIRELMDAGQFATNVELTETQNHYRSALAQSIWYLRHDFSEMTEGVPLLSSLDEYRGGGYPDETARLAKALSDPQALASITKDMEFFSQVYAQQRGVLRFHYHDVPMLLEGLHNLETPWKEYSTDMYAVPKTEQFITEDEVDEALAHGSSVSGGKGRIYRYFSDEHSTKERTDFLREEYGIGGHSGALSNKAHSFEDHDGKGIRLSKTDCAEVTLSWNVVVKRIDSLVKSGRYLTEKELAQLEQAHSEPVQTAPAEPEPAVQEAASPAKEAASPTVSDLYMHYLPIVRDAVLADTAYQNACRNSDRENAMTEGNAAINRAVISLYDTQLYGLFYDNTAFHNRLTEAVLEETYAQLSPHAEERTEPEPEDDDFSDIDPEWVRARLAEHGIVNGEVVDPEKLAQSPFIQMVEADVARIAAEEDAAEAAQDEPEPPAEDGSDTLAPEDRFHVVDVDWYPGRPAYSIWDDQTGDYYVDRDGVTIDFVSRWDAEEYRDDLIDTLRQEEKPMPEPSLAEQADQFDAERDTYREQVLSGLTPDQQRIVTAMETAGFPFRPTESTPIYFGDLDDYPITFDSWEAAYDFIDSAELKDFPGLREQVQAVLHPEPAFPYHAGDTVYLEDGKPFVIESIGTFDVQLRDPVLRYPVFRAESRENFLRLMERYPQNQQEEPASEQPAMTEETVGFYPGEQNGLPFDVEIRTLRFDEPEREAPTPEVSGVTPETPETAVFEDVYGTEPGQMPGDVLATDGQTDNLPPTPESAPESVTEPSIPAANFRITDDHLGEGGPKQKYAYNVAAIRTLQTLEAEHRNATPEEQQILSRYVGWGSLADAFDSQKDSWANEYRELKGLLTEEEYAAARASTLNAHYTSPAVIRAIYEAVGQMGFTSGNILEPSMGVGNFFGLLPDSMAGSKLYGVELDSITGRIAQKLYPNADIKVAGFESTDRRDFYDLAVGNVPFGDYKVNDKPYNKLGFSIHNYFFAKALGQVRPGGVVAFVTSRYTMDAKSPEVRKYLAQRAELLGAVRLPNNAFRANAGTDVVSDIIFLQKREHPIDIEPEWVHLGQTPDGLTLNSYFIDHPEMVLGELTTESTQYGREECTVIPIPGADLSEQLHEAVTHIQGSYQAIALEAEEVDVADGPQPIPADPNVKNFSYTIVDGEVYFRENSVMKPVELNDTAKGRMKGLVELRQIVNDLIAYQLEDYPEADIAAKQQELNAAYDSFTERYGLINSRGNSLAFSEDSSYYLLCSLENIDEDGQLIGKADMFTKRTIRPERKVTSVDTPSEALAISIGEKGAVDLPFMAELLGTPGEYDAIVSGLHGVIFKDPMGPDAPEEGWQTADEYLSGNVRDKLRIATMAADRDPAFAVNVEALTKAQPKDLDASEIDVRLGATWIDPKYFQQFMHETFQTPFYMRRTIEVKYSTHTAEWRITGKTQPRYDDVAANMTFGTSRANAYRILEDTLNLKDVRIYDTVEDADGKQKRVLNKKETTLAQQKQQAIKDAFQDWVWKDPKRREALCQKYNELFNSTRPREFDGSHIHFVGMNPEIMLREHQRNAIAHVLYGGNTLLAHEVGAGKTFEMAAAAMESKRLGLCQKSMFVVPNHLTLQWANEFLRLYPSAKLLVTTKKDFETSRRKKFCARIATGDYDAVIIGHSQFEKIPISAERQERQLREQIEDIEDAIAELKYSRGENFTIKQMEKSRKSLQARLNKLTSTERKDDVITFEQLGVDRLFVDESQAYKNLFLYTKMRNVAGLSTSEAQRSSDMFMKCRYMDEITGGRGVVFASGTPVSNSMTELYTVMRYLQYSTLQQKGLTHFDSWASTFGETTTAIELSPEGYTLLRRWFRVRLK